MHIKFLAREGVEVLRGNPDMVAAVADTLAFEHRYTSGVTVRVSDSPAASAPEGLRRRESRDDRISIPYTERPRSGGVNRLNRGGFPRDPARSGSRIRLRQRHLRRLPLRSPQRP